MIDIENLVFDTVYNGVTTVHQNMNVCKGFIEESATFPCIVVREVNNVPVQTMNTDDCAENFTRVTYQIDIYSDKQGTQRSECRELLKLVDGIMQSMKFRRIHMNEPLNIKPFALVTHEFNPYLYRTVCELLNTLAHRYAL